MTMRRVICFFATKPSLNVDRMPVTRRAAVAPSDGFDKESSVYVLRPNLHAQYCSEVTQFIDDLSRRGPS